MFLMMIIDIYKPTNVSLQSANLHIKSSSECDDNRPEMLPHGLIDYVTKIPRIFFFFLRNPETFLGQKAEHGPPC